MIGAGEEGVFEDLARVRKSLGLDGGIREC